MMTSGSDDRLQSARYGRADDVVYRRIAGEDFLIVLHAGESKMFSLNKMGLWFWRHLESPVGKAELLSAMLRDYEVEEPVAAHEIDRFLDEMLAKRLAVTVTSPSA